MNINEHDATTVWRDLAAGLTADQYALVEAMEVTPSPWTGDVLAALLLRHTREAIRENRRGHL
ncbi:MAG: hypothetical protein QOG14_1277 [Mycobacterium sp.]|jgi:hypothetical protein|nr:hypothetical protein [Mycobacterium sp.]